MLRRLRNPEPPDPRRAVFVKRHRAFTASMLLAAACSAAGTPPRMQSAASTHSGSTEIGWAVYGRDAGGTRFSPARAITTANVHLLEPAWTYRTGETEERFSTEEETACWW